MKLVTVVLCSLVVFALSQSARAEQRVSGAGNKRIGQRQDGDQLLHDGTVSKSFGPWRVDAQYNYADSNIRITHIEMIDNSGTDTGAAIYDVYGGVGRNYVRIDFESMPLRGIYYGVKIYGYRD